MSRKIKCRPQRGRRGCLLAMTPTPRQWKKAAPFAMSTMGVLFHRVHNVTTFYKNDHSPRNDHVDYWCSNSTNDPLFFDAPPKDRLLCARCEAAAVAAGEPTAATIAGCHVHIGELRAQRLCCPNDGN